MTIIETPQGPGHFVSKWRSEGPVDSNTLELWKNEMEWPSWLPLAEAALFLDAPELLDTMDSLLSPAERSVLGLVRRRWLGDTHLLEPIETALEITRNPETRDLALEGRLRMERGLVRYEAGDIEGADEDLTWAETRLKSVALASRDHDLSLINKAALHTACGEPVMALTVYSEIPRNGSHADETIALSRLGASRICAALGHEFNAARHAWNAHAHAIKANQIGMAIEGGALFLDFASSSIDESAEKMHVQVENSRPREAGEDAHELTVHPDDIDNVFDWCCSNMPEESSGSDRPDLRAMVSLAHRLDKLDSFSETISNPDSVEDPMLAAIVQSFVEDQHLKGLWDIRLATLTML